MNAVAEAPVARMRAAFAGWGFLPNNLVIVATGTISWVVIV